MNAQQVPSNDFQSNNNNNNANNVVVEEENPHTSRQLKGAAAAGAAAGLILGGPLLAAVAAGGAAYAVTSKGDAGNMVRNCGDAVADAGVSLKRYNRKHKVVEKTTNNITKGANWAAKRLQPKQQQQAQATN